MEDKIADLKYDLDRSIETIETLLTELPNAEIEYVLWTLDAAKNFLSELDYQPERI